MDAETQENREMTTFEGTLKRAKEGNALSQNLLGLWILHGDLPDEIGARIHPDFPSEYAARYWHRLQNAKTYLHQQTLPLRSGASEEFIAQLNHTESALDSVFVHIVNQEYYMRLFVDCYEEIMPQEIDKCFEELN